jgi:hypothetical protein
MAVAIEEVTGGRQPDLDRDEKLTVGDLAVDVTPEHLGQVKPEAVGRLIYEDKLVRRAPLSSAKQIRPEL